MSLPHPNQKSDTNVFALDFQVYLIAIVASGLAWRRSVTFVIPLEPCILEKKKHGKILCTMVGAETTQDRSKKVEFCLRGVARA